MKSRRVRLGTPFNIDANQQVTIYILKFSFIVFRASTVDRNKYDLYVTFPEYLMVNESC